MTTRYPAEIRRTNIVQQSHASPVPKTLGKRPPRPLPTHAYPLLWDTTPI